MWVGNTEANIRNTFAAAAAKAPALWFIDEVDALAAARDTGMSPGTWNRGYNNITIQMMQSVDRHRGTSGLIIMAATNALDNLDPALVREGRFDIQIRVDLPDEPTRKRFYEAQLSRKPWKRCNLDEFARRTPGASAAKIKSTVDRAAALAAEENRQIEERDLRRALDETGARIGHCSSRLNGRTWSSSLK
jgi:cell division protease FtsH